MHRPGECDFYVRTSLAVFVSKRFLKTGSNSPVRAYIRIIGSWLGQSCFSRGLSFMCQSRPKYLRSQQTETSPRLVNTVCMQSIRPQKQDKEKQRRQVNHFQFCSEQLELHKCHPLNVKVNIQS